VGPKWARARLAVAKALERVFAAQDGGEQGEVGGGSRVERVGGNRGNPGREDVHQVLGDFVAGGDCLRPQVFANGGLEVFPRTFPRTRPHTIRGIG